MGLIQKSFDRQPWCWTVLIFCTERRRGASTQTALRYSGKTLSFTWEFSIFSVKSAYCVVECRSAGLQLSHDWRASLVVCFLTYPQLLFCSLNLVKCSGRTGEKCVETWGFSNLCFLSCVMCLFKRKWYGCVYVNVPELFFNISLIRKNSYKSQKDASSLLISISLQK